MNKVFNESHIVSFLSRLNRNIIEYYFNSFTHRVITKCREFFKKIILENINNSAILGSLSKATKGITLSDTGLFIVFTTVFNTLGMLFLNREMDLFSIISRICFLCMGTGLILREYVRNMRLR